MFCDKPINFASVNEKKRIKCKKSKKILHVDVICYSHWCLFWQQ